MVPTTVLAAQHHAKLCALVEALPLAARKRLWGGAAGGDLEPLLLTGETKVSCGGPSGAGLLRIGERPNLAHHFLVQQT